MMKQLLLAFLLIFTTVPAFAQSLKSEAPSPIQAGVNKGTVDCFVGTHYWYFTGGPGKTHVHVQFVPMGLFGNANRTSVTFSLFDEGRTWSSPKVLTSDKQMVDYTFEGDLKKPTKILISVAPPSNALVRSGGDYEIVVTGAVAYGPQSTQEPIIGTYKQMGGYTNLLGTCKFEANGAIETTSGANGHWKLFDKDSGSYIIDVDGQERHTLQYKAGRGLCDGDMILFQLLN